MGAISGMTAALLGLFAFASAHYAFQWWFSRSERILRLFSVYCALCATFSVFMLSLLSSTTVLDAQSSLDRLVTAGVMTHAVVLEFYAHLNRRENRGFRLLV